MHKTAIVIGATGLVGQELVAQLIKSNEYSLIKLFVRKTVNYDSSKIEVYIVDFDRITDWRDQIVGDTIFCCLGTTLKKAKSKEVQFKIDHTYTLSVVSEAIKNGCSTVLLVSSLGANSNSSNFYLATKGKLETDITSLHPIHFAIFRPSILDGNRIEKRPFEQFALKVMRVLGKYKIVQKYAPTSVVTLSKKMIDYSIAPSKGMVIFENIR